jgi:hypothetical protein
MTPLSEDVPNILIDDAGPGLPDIFGGEVRTDTLSKVPPRPLREHYSLACKAKVRCERGAGAYHGDAHLVHLAH